VSHCVDVYAHTSSGEESLSGAFTTANDLVRVCRCDRTTDTCTPCTGGACDEP
jgi:hypothetical protein